MSIAPGPFPSSFAHDAHRHESFNDALSDWMQRAPWLALSAAAHVLLVLVLLAIPWHELTREPPTEIHSSIEQVEEMTFEDPPVETPQEVKAVDIVEPVIQDVNIPDEISETPDDPSDTPFGDSSVLSDTPFESTQFSGEIGIGGGAGNKFGNRFGDGRGKGGGGGSGTELAVLDGLEWLRAHQSPDGSWDSDGFAANCGKVGASTCSDPGEAQNDIGATGLALLAFLGDGNTTREGRFRDNVARGVKWLKEQQDPDTGLFGGRVGHAYMYNHAIATLAMCEAYYFSRSPIYVNCAKRAVEYIMAARNPYGAWRYDSPPSGENDTSVTGWMVLALKSAEEAKLPVDRESFVGALSWLDEVTDPATGRVGYDSIGSASSRVTRINDHFNAQRGEAMTAVGLLCRFFLGEDPERTPIMEKQADLIAQSLPKWNPDPAAKDGVDFYYWYYGSYAMYQMGGSKHWDRWNKAMKAAVVDSQRKDGDAKGSWDAHVDPWGHSGGRVYTTALGVLCLEVYYRYARVLGGR